ncbi:MAG: chemotaxis protein CheW [Gammaproteobacteria bacterium]
MANHNKDAELIDEKQALTMFFSSLLTDTQDTVTAEQKNTDSSEAKNFKDITVSDSTVFLPVIPPIVNEDELTEIEPEIIDVTELDMSATQSNSRVIDGEFQVMMFKTAGLTLAVPLVELSGVITWPENITEMPGHKESYLGIVQHLGKKVPIIDIAQIVFPQEQIESINETQSKDRLQRIVFINDFEWGLACDAVNDVITLESDQIKWRKSGTKRAWLAGTVVEHMCALLDTQELSKLLNSDLS